MSGKTFHCLSKVGEQGVIGGIFTGGVHLKLSALGGLCSLEVHLDVIIRSIRVGSCLFVIVTPQLSSRIQYSLCFLRKLQGSGWSE